VSLSMPRSRGQLQRDPTGAVRLVHELGLKAGYPIDFAFFGLLAVAGGFVVFKARDQADRGLSLAGLRPAP
jgi:hypothetical protein